MFQHFSVFTIFNSLNDVCFHFGFCYTVYLELETGENEEWPMSAAKEREIPREKLAWLNQQV